MNKNRNKAMIKFIVLLIFSIIVLYPLVWMIMSSFKEESTIFSNLGILPSKFVWENYKIGWQSNGRTTFSTYFKNSIIFAILCVVGNLIACTLTAYALVRIKCIR